MFKSNKMQYVIKTVPGDNTQELQNLLNEMSMNGWELYSMHEIETDEGVQCNCIFMSEMANTNKSNDTVDISTFRSQMEKMLSPELNSYEICLDIQGKIRSQQAQIAKAKAELENGAADNAASASASAGGNSAAPHHSSRKRLNDKISAGLKELDELREKLARTTSPDEMYSKLGEEKFAVCLSGEIPGEDSLDELVAQTVKLRLKLTEELGFVVPKILFRDDENLNPFEFSIKIRGVDVFKSHVYPDYRMYYADELKLEKKIKNSIYDIDSITGRKIVWLEKEKTKSFWQNGLSSSEYIVKAVEYTAVRYVDELLDYEELEKYVEIVNNKNPYLVENIIPDFISLADLRFILTNLIKERVSIKDITYIFEKMNDYAQDNTRSDLLNKIRLSLSRRICHDNANEDGIITAFEVSEKSLIALAPDFDESELVRIDADAAEKFAAKLQRKLKQAEMSDPKLIAPIDFRHLIFTLLSHYMHNITVLAREEIGCNCTLDIIGEV